MTMNSSPNINYCWAALLIEELGRCGVEAAFVSPGSRSSSLALSIARSKKIKSFVHFDERGTGFAALGFAAANRKPTIVITTSGTAVANLFPAVVEASKKKLPLIILTADRPPELRQTGAHQTIDQVNFFGRYTQWSVDLPCPSSKITPSFILTTVDQAVYRAKSGPVHLNCMFREPLVPIKDSNNLSVYLKPLAAWLKSKEPFTTYHSNRSTLTNSSVSKLSKIINESTRGIIVVGKLADADDQEATLKLAQKLNWPIFADIASGLRLGSKDTHVIHYYDQLLRSEKLTERIAPECVIHLGGRITSKRWYQFIEKVKPAHYLMILNHPLRNDPLHAVTERIQIKVSTFCETLSSSVKTKSKNQALAFLFKANKKLDQLFQKELSQSDSISEAAIARTISKLIPQRNALFLSNSLPIREMDMFAAMDGPAVRVEGNRGASGIDGIVATAVGFSFGLNKPITLLIGDLALLHDLNSMALVKNLTHPMTIVVINNDGGGIFSFLPIADKKAAKDDFEKFFGTPHGLKFSGISNFFALEYARPRTLREFGSIYNKHQKSKKSLLIEIVTSRQSTVSQMKRLEEITLKSIR